MKHANAGKAVKRLGIHSITNKLFFLTINAVLGIVLMTAFLLYEEHGLILKERQTSVKQAVETAAGILDYYQARVEKKEMALEEAQRRAMTAVRTMRYGGGEYFWINDMTPTMRMHPIKPALDNTDLSQNKDANGKRQFVEMVDTVKKDGAGFVFYMWPKPGSEAPAQKVSYVKGFPAWGWIIGSGVYIDTVEATVWAQARYAGLIAVGLGSILALIGLLVARSVTRPIREAVQIAWQVAHGDLTSQIEVASKDETGQLMQALKDMNSNLVTIVAGVHRGTDTIATASSQIAAGNLDLSSRTEQQASSLEETASAMEELTSTVKQNADNARQANQLAQSAAAIAEQGGQEVLRVVKSMESIDASARRVSDIIAVIDGIAFQTNILSLNAAVEAARAGEHGRGFAVVASEVRNLAQRSATAAREIKGLIADSTKEVENGSVLARHAGSTMQEVVSSITRVNDIVSEISAASAEQSAGIEQVNKAISQMDQVTQQNAALVEEAAAAATSLNEQAQVLSQSVSTFNIGQVASSNWPAPLPTASAAVLPSKPAHAVPTRPVVSRLAPAPRRQAVEAEEWEQF